jgi:hypothetical protein
MFGVLDSAVNRGMGGAMAHKLRHAHQWTPEEARDAGRKGKSGPVEEPSIRDPERVAAVSPHAPLGAQAVGGIGNW